MPPIAGAFGVWQIRESPIGYVPSRNEHGVQVDRCSAHGRDDAGGCPWLRTTDSLNRAVA